MATSQLVSNSLENKINNDTRDYSRFVDPEKAREFYATSDYLRANADKYNLNPFSSNNNVSANYGNSNTKSTSYNKGAIVNPNISSNRINYSSGNDAGYNTNNLVSQLQSISNKVGNFGNNLTTKEQYLSNLTNKITELINNQKQATTGLYNTAYQNEIDQLNYAKQQATNQAKEQQREIRGTKAQQLLALEQALARQGLIGSGEALSNRLALDIASEENANEVGLNLQDQLGEIEMQGIISLRNKDEGIKNALAQIDSDEAQYMLNAYQEAENYNMNLLNQQLNIAQTQADIQSAINDAQYRQAQFEENIRQYNESLAEQIRQYNTDLEESKRQYETSLAEQIRQFNEELAYKKEYAKSNSLADLLGEDIESVETTSNNKEEEELNSLIQSLLNTSTKSNTNNSKADPLKFYPSGYFTLNK